MRLRHHQPIIKQAIIELTTFRQDPREKCTHFPWKLAVENVWSVSLWITHSNYKPGEICLIPTALPNAAQMARSLSLLVCLALLGKALAQDITLEIDNLGIGHAPRKEFLGSKQCWAPLTPRMHAGGVSDSTLLGKDQGSGLGGQSSQLFFATDPGLLTGPSS